jgi:hypothetical protein
MEKNMKTRTVVGKILALTLVLGLLIATGAAPALGFAACGRFSE